MNEKIINYEQKKSHLNQIQHLHTYALFIVKIIEKKSKKMVNTNTDITNENHSKIPRKHSKKTRRISETKERRSSYTFGFKRCAIRHLAMSNNKSLTGKNLGKFKFKNYKLTLIPTQS